MSSSFLPQTDEVSPTRPRAKLPSPQKLALSYLSPRKQHSRRGHDADPPEKDLWTLEPEPSTCLPLTSFLGPNLSFSLVADGELRTPSSSEVKEIFRAFPNCREVGAGLTLRLLFSHGALPPKPWPISVAGCPAKFLEHDENGKQPPEDNDQGVGGHPRKVLELPAGLSPAKWQPLSSATITAIARCYKDQYGLTAELMEWRWAMLIITAQEGFDITSFRLLPGRIGASKVIVCYKASDQAVTKHHYEAALRAVLPEGEVRDDTDYGTDLCPGIMLSCGRGRSPGELLTTSGIPLRAQDGQKFITVASHGFPGSSCPVFHPSAGGRIIGHVERRIEHCDIALLKLGPGYRYSAETFSGGDEPASVIRELRESDTIKYADPLYFNSPFSGACAAQNLIVLYRRLPTADDNEAEYLTMRVLWTGNGDSKLRQGTCGSGYGMMTIEPWPSTGSRMTHNQEPAMLSPSSL